ncbi:ATP-binding cassette subfamily G member 4-like [Schistocerca piceifrons]|uniref:ATP-binding cassette subfamily G member 4-like n=1 Tax=Schistocerca piceifrons TaxID=274613 RepID=UPI001F5FC739|nr:ATP-binding cassette subfamily G member 4-like [Schistocerca piceifrons]
MVMTEDGKLPPLLVRKESRFTRMAKRPRVDIEFHDLCFSVRSAGVRSGRRSILKGVGGKFRPGLLSVIMGPSGAGKSSLMNVLAGLVTAGVTGTINTNGQPRQLKLFHKLSTYIMQEDLLQPHMTVQENMEMAASLKVGREMSHDEQVAAVEEILETLGLLECRSTLTDSLSGGQRKRLSVALELVNNPPVIFLDEPTTGLDVVAIQHCVQLLKLLASQGHTVVCTVHQPSAMLFNAFDHVYLLSRGQCVFQGQPRALVPFLAEQGLECPINHNPADFILEMVQGENAGNVTMLSAEMMNGRVTAKLDTETNTVRLASVFTDDTQMPQYDYALMFKKDSHWSSDFPTSFFMQFIIILRRMLLQKSRNTVALWLQFIHHLGLGIILGSLYFGVGNDATKPFVNFKFPLCCLVFFMYTHVMTPALLFPTEVKILKREYFNRWYGLKSYFMALTCSTAPFMIIFGMIFTLFAYLLCGHPVEISRFLLFSLFGILVGMVSEGLGLIMGSIFNVVNGSIMAPATVAPMLVLSAYGFGHGTAMEPVMTVLSGFSYLRYGLVGLTSALYSHGRAPLYCDDVFCLYKDPKRLLRDVGMDGASTLLQVVALVGFIFLYRTIAYFALRYRLTIEFSNKLLSYIAKILRRK